MGDQWLQPPRQRLLITDIVHDLLDMKARRIKTPWDANFETKTQAPYSAGEIKIFSKEKKGKKGGERGKTKAKTKTI